MLSIFVYVFLFILGTVFGSMVNVLIFRLPLGQEVVVKPSHCMKCDKKIKPYDLIPIISYIFLRGKCRYCGEKVSIQYPIIEFLTGLIFVGIFYMFGWPIGTDAIVQTISFTTVVNLISVYFIAIIFLTVFVIDLYHYIIPDEMVIFGLISGVVLCVARAFTFSISGFQIVSPIVFKAGPIWDALIGLGIGFGIFLLIVLVGEWVMKAEVMGMGDVKLMAVVGLYLGMANTLVAMFMSFIIGSIVSVFLLITKIKGRKDQIPFGPFIVAGSTVALLWGTQLLNWYFNIGR